MNLGPPAETPVDSLERELNRTRMPRGYDTLADVIGSHYTILTILADDTVEHTVSRVRDALGVDLSTASRQVSYAARLGLLAWSQSLHDRRVRILNITVLGRRLLARAQRERHDSLGDVFTGWSDDDVRDFLRLTRRLNADSARLLGKERARQ